MRTHHWWQYVTLTDSICLWGYLLTRDGKCESDTERKIEYSNHVNGALYAFMF